MRPKGGGLRWQFSRAASRVSSFQMGGGDPDNQRMHSFPASACSTRGGVSKTNF